MEDATLSKMKVADLKKELKNRGLPVTGNKNELVQRLQLALEGGENAEIPEGEGGEEEFDEEDILGDEDEEVMEEEISPQEEEAALEGIRLKDPVTLLAPEKKKISLKRSEPPLPTPVEKEEEKEEVKEEKKEEVKEDKEVEKAEGKENIEAPARKLIKLDSDSSDKSPLEVRAERFGVPMTEDARKASRAARFGSSSNGTTKGGPQAKLSMETGVVDMDKLKARAERFGEVTSKSLTKLSEAEKIKQREARFGAGATSDDKTKTEGNVLITSFDKTKITAPTTTTADKDDVMKKRAERFAAK